MKFIWMSSIIIIIINVTRAKNLSDILLEYRNINGDLSKASKPPSYVITKSPSIGVFPSLPNRGNKFMVDLKSPIETYSQVTKSKAEITTRRSLMQVKKFTVRPHDVYQEPVREKHNWNSNQPKNQRNVGKTNYKPIKKETRFHNLKYLDSSVNGNDYNLSEKQDNKNSYVSPNSRNSKPKLLFPKRNIKYFKENPEQNVYKEFQINNFFSESKLPFNVAINSNNGLRELEENIKVPFNIFIKSDSKDQMEIVIEPKENIYDEDEFIPVRANDISFGEPDVADDDEEMTTDSDIEYLVPRSKRSVNIIEEERIATTLSGFRMTNQDYPISHDLTFKNIHT